MPVSTRAIRLFSKPGFANALENIGLDRMGDGGAEAAVARAGLDFTLQRATGTGTGTGGRSVADATNGALSLEPVSTLVSTGFTELGFGDSPYFLTADNLAAIGFGTDVGAFSKLQYGLAEIFIEAQMGLNGATGAARDAALESFTSLNGAANVGGGYVAIDAVAANGDGAALLAALEAMGLERGASFGRLAGGLMPIDMLDELAGLGLLGFARPVYAETNVGATTSQNVASLNGDYLQSLGFTGTGITIGIMSDSFNTATITTSGGALTVHYAEDIASGDLPSGINILADFTSATTIDEGRAMAQLIHDMAPGATLQFHTAFVSMADFASGIMDLVNAGSDIVVDDIRYFAEPFFQDGAIAQAVDAATAAGAMYFSSAGNQGSFSYASEFRHSGQFIALPDGNTYEFHDFDPGAGIDTQQSFARAGTVTYTLNWDQPNFSVSGGTGSQSNMAWLLINSAGGGSFTSTNNIGGDAIEVAQSAGAFVNLGLLLRVGDATPGRIQYVLSGSVAINEFATNSGTSFGHSNAATGLSVAAVDWGDSARFAGVHSSAALTAGSPFPYLESFSSRGDIPILFDTAGNRLSAPAYRSNVDFASGDGGNTTFFGSDVTYDADSFGNFFGTSAAAPNAAAIAALLMQAFPTATRTQIETVLKQSAIDVQFSETNAAVGVGYDNISGWGLIQADRAYVMLADMLTNALILTAGEIAIIGYNTDAATAGEPGDLLSFVLLSGLDSGATIYFTDRSWNGTAFAAAGGGDGTYTYTAASNLAAGTVITISAAQLSGGGVDLSDAGDTVYAYQGSINAPTHFLYAADIADGNTTFNGNLTGTGLAAGQNAVAVGTDSGAYSGPTTHSASFMHNGNGTTLIQSVSDSANWVGTDTKEAEVQIEPWLTNANIDLWGVHSGAGGGIVRTSADPTFGSGNNDSNHIRLYDNLLSGGNNVFYGLRDIHFDTVEGKFFVVDSDIGGGHNRILQGNIADLLSNPGTMPTLTVLYSDVGTTTDSRLDNLDIDTTNNRIYFTHGDELIRINYDTAGQAGTMLFRANVDAAGSPSGVGNPAGSASNFYNDMVINFATGEIYLASTRVGAAASGDLISKNFIYHLTGLTLASGVDAFQFNAANTGTARLLPFAQNDDAFNPNPGTTASPASAAQAPYFFPMERGSIDGLALDPVTNTLYFSTGEILFDHDLNNGTAPLYQGGVVASYALGANTANGQGNITVLHQQNIQFGGAIPGLMGDLEIDSANGHWYVLDYNGINGVNDDNHIFRGNLNGTGTPIQFSQEIGDSQGAAQVGFHINHAPTAAANNLVASVTEASNLPGSGITGGALLWNSVALSDVDTGNSVDELAGAVVRISAGFQAGATHQDLLRIAGTTSGTIAGSGIAYNYNSTTGAMVLTGAATVAEYQSAIASVTFSTSGDNVTNYGYSTSRTVSFSVFDGLSMSDEVHNNVNVVGINDAPINVPGGTAAGAEDTTFALTGMSVSDVDADPAAQDIQVTLSVTRGTITLFTNVGGGIELSDVTGNGTGTVTVIATQNQINATFAAPNGVTYTPNAHYNGNDTLTITTNDLGLNGNDPGLTGTGTSEQDQDTKAITISVVNDAPFVAGDGTEDSATILEDQPQTNLTASSISTLFGGQYSDALDNQVPNGGASSAGAFTGIAVVTNNSNGAQGQWQYWDGAAWQDVGASSLAAAKTFTVATLLRFNPALNYNGPEPTLVVRLIDDSGPAITNGGTVNISAFGATGGTTPYSATGVTLGGTITPVNDAPTSTNLATDAATYTENQVGATLLDVGSDVSIGDVDSANFDGGTLTVAITGGLVAGEDQLGISTVGTVTFTANTVSVGGVQIATYTGGGAGGGALVFTFDADATPAAVTELMRAINYSNSGGENPTGGVRTIGWTLVDGDGTLNGGADTLGVTSSVNVVAVNDAPQGTDATIALNEDGSRILVAADFGFSDAGEGNAFAGVVITTLPTNGVLLLNGVPITVAGTFVTAAQIGASQLVFQPDADENGTPYATFTFQVRDNGGILNGGQDTDQSPNTLTFNVNSVNDAPTSTNLNGDAATYAEGAPFALLDVGSNATLADIDSANFDTGTLTVSITGGLVAAEDQLILTNTGTVTFTANTVSVGGVQIATYTGGGAGGGNLVFTFDADATPAAVQTLIQAIGYTNSDLTSPTGGIRTIGWTLVDGDGVALGGADTLTLSSTVEVINVNSAPAGADNTLALNEDGSRILAAADFGFSDPAEGDNFAGVVVTTLPTNGVLLLNGIPVTVAGTFVTAAQISANQLVFQPDADENGTPYATFTFQVRDDGGIANGGQDTDQSPNTLTFNVNPVNDAPTSTNLNGDAAIWVEGSAAVLLDVGSNATVADIDSADFDGGTLTVSISGGVVAQDGLFIEAAGGITSGAGTVSFMGTQIGTFTGGGYGGGPLVFTFDADANPGAVQALVRAISYNNNGGISPTEGLRTISWSLVDGDGVALGGADTHGATTTVDVQAINDAPTGTSNAFTINEDATYTFAASSFGFGDVNGDQFAGVVVTTIPVPGTLFYDADGAGGADPVAVTAGQFVSAADIALGRLFYTPVLNGNGVPFSSFTFQVRDDGGTGNGGQDTDQSPNTVTFNVTAVNDAPTNTVPGGQTINEDASFTLSTGNGNAISVADVDATTLTVTLSVAHGTLTIASTLGLSFSGGSDGTADASMTFSGTAAAINAALGAGLTYNPNANFNGADAISVVTTDGGQTGTGPVGTDSDSIAIAITAINDAPVVIGDGTESATAINEDTPGAGQTIQALFAGQYSDAADNQIPNGGASSPGQFSGIAVTANGSSAATGQWQYFSGGVWTDIGAVSDAAAKLFGDPFVTLIRFNPAPDYNGPAPTLTVHLIDNSLPFGIVNGQVVDISGPGATGGTTAYSTGTVVLSQTVNAVNDAPVNSVPGAQTINEDASFTLSTGNGNAISVADVDATTLSVTLSVANGTLTLASTLGLSFSGGSDGTADATMTFSGTAAAINAALGSGLTYNPTANYNGPDAISVVTTDTGQTGSGPVGTDSDTVAITVNSVNDAPSGANNTVTGSEDDPLVLTAADFGFSDPIDGNAFLAVIIDTFPANGTLFLDVDGPGGNPPIDLSSIGPGVFVNVSDINLGRLYFQPDTDEFGDDYATFTFRVQDDGGMANGGVDRDQTANTITIDITPDNLPPVVDLDGGTGGVDYAVTFTEDGAAVAIGSGVIVTDPNSGTGDMIESATITLTDRVAGDSLTLTGALPPGFVEVTTNLAGSITIQITGQGTGAQYQALIESILYSTTSQDPSVGGTDPARTITVTANDGLVDSLVATTTVNITAVDDAPVAQPDAFTITESGTIIAGNLFANNGSGADSDPDGPPLAISAVSGGTVGTQFMLASGALLTVNANGTFDYDSNGAFDFTPIAGSGASNTPSMDSFTYTLAGGNSVTVNITLTGLDTNDILLGTAGADILAGGNGDDLYYVENAADQVLEANGAGDDRVVTSVGYVLTGGSHVETLEAASGAGGISLTGNALDNLLLGHDGNNSLHGGGGAGDVLSGLGGNDTYYTDVATTAIIEAAGGGNDALYTSLSYVLLTAEVETLSTNNHASSAAINLTGNHLNQTIVGNAGANILHGGGGTDVLIGLGGNDTYYVDVAATQAYEAIGGGTDALYTSVSYTLAGGSEVETLSTNNHSATSAINLTGNALNNILVGNAGANILHGGGGTDQLIGLAGDDTYYTDSTTTQAYEGVGGGNDALYTSVSYTLAGGSEIETLSASSHGATTAISLTGNQFANMIYGNAGNNVIDGKGGADDLIGFGGQDVFAFTTALGVTNIDRILGFNAADDTIALDDAIFTGLALGALNPNAFVTGAAALDANDRIIYNNLTGQLLFDADGSGSGAAVHFAIIATGLSLTASDFTVI